MRPREALLSDSPFAGMTRIRFYGYDLSPSKGTPSTEGTVSPQVFLSRKRQNPGSADRVNLHVGKLLRGF